MTSGFGAAGSVVVLLVWVYYSAQIFLLGAELTSGPGPFGPGRSPRPMRPGQGVRQAGEFL